MKSIICYVKKVYQVKCPYCDHVEEKKSKELNYICNKCGKNYSVWCFESNRINNY